MYSLFHLFLVLAPLLVLIVALRKPRKVENSYGRDVPPGPYPWPIVGNLLHMRNGPHIHLAELAKIYGPLISVKVGSLRFVVGSSQEAATEILKTPDRVPTSRWVPKAGQEGLEQYSLIWATQCTGHWKYLRSLCRTEVFSANAIESPFSLREKKIAELVDFLKNKEGAVLKIREVVLATSVNILGNICFSKDFMDFEDEGNVGSGLKRALNRLRELGTTPNICDFFPYFENLDPQGLKNKTSEVMKETFKVWETIIRERREKREGRKFGTESSGEQDFCDVMLSRGFSDLQINQMAVELFSGGTHSTASTVEWAMAELLKNKEAMFKIREELRREIGPATYIKESQISQLPYVYACFKETLRLHPPAPLLHPQCVLEKCEIMNFTIPENSQLIVNMWAMGRDPKCWEDPLSFKPERFLESNLDFKGQDFRFLPFGVGRRMCPGLPLASRQIPFILASLIHSFDWVLPHNKDPSKLDMNGKFGIILQKKKPLLLVPKCI